MRYVVEGTGYGLLVGGVLMLLGFALWWSGGDGE